MTKITPPLRYPGGKQYLAPHLYQIASGVPHTTRAHPFAGGLGEFWEWPHEDVCEIVNDLHGQLVDFYRVLAHPKLFQEFKRRVEATPLSREVWEWARDFCEEPPLLIRPSVELALAYFVRVRQSMMGLGKGWAPLSTNRTRRGMNEQASAWWGAVEGLGAVHERLKRVAIENRDALDFIRAYDGPKTLHVMDPPYYPGTRQASLYRHEMSEEDHHRLLSLIQGLQGKILLCSYSCAPYEEALSPEKGWHRTEIELASAMSTTRVKDKRVEVVWTNFPPGESP